MVQGTIQAATSIEISGIRFDPGLDKHLDQFFTERFPLVVLLLMSDVLLDGLPSGRANRKCRVAFLSGKRWQANLLMNPDRRDFFQFAHDVGQAMGGPQTDEKMDMIGNATDSLREPTQPGNRAAQILMQTRTPLHGDSGFAVFCPEHQNGNAD
jgi:hypothetical protein